MDNNQRHRLADSLLSDLTNTPWPSNAQEPDYVATLVNVLPGYITNSLTQILPRCAISSGGAFIHQKPLAHFLNRTGMKDPELGDLLVVCRERRFSGTVYNAMLLQAKCTANPFCTSLSGDHQFVLYSEWPEFEYKRAGVLNGKRRSVLPKTITQGAQYLLIAEKSPIELYTATVNRSLNGSKLFAMTLASIISFDAGRTFQVNNPRDHWSQMILDLLRMTASSVYTRRNSGFVGAIRWKGDEAFDYILNGRLQNNNDINNKTLLLTNENSKDNNSGINVVCVDLGARS